MTPQLRKIALWMAIGFLAVAVIMTATVGWRFAGPVLAAALALVTIGAAILPSFAHHSWAAGHKVSAVGIGIVAGVFAVAEYVSHVSYSVTHRSAEVETVSHQKTAHDDTRSTISDLEAKERTLDAQSRWESRSLPDVIAAIEAAKVHKRWTSTDGCTDVTASASRTFCTAYASLIAEKANAEEALVARAELDKVRAELASMRQVAKDDVPETSIAATTDTIVAMAISLTLQPSADARKAAGIGIGSWLALAVSLGAGMFWFIAHMPAPSAGAPVAPSEHPDITALLDAQKAALATLKGMTKQINDPPANLARRRILQGRVATPAGGLVEAA